jgi:hypothetical protein
MNRRWIMALVAMTLLVPAWSHAVDSSTPPTPASAFTPLASPAPDGQERRSDAIPAAPGKRVFVDTQTFEGGAQIGTTASGASKLNFVSRVTCTLNPSSLTVPGMTQYQTCVATGALAGDFATCSLPAASASGVVIKSVATGTNLVGIEFVGISDAAFPDVGAIAIPCLVVR